LKVKKMKQTKKEENTMAKMVIKIWKIDVIIT